MEGTAGRLCPPREFSENMGKSAATPLARYPIITSANRASRKLMPLPRCRIDCLEASLARSPYPVSLLDQPLRERLDCRLPVELLGSRIAEVNPA